MKDIIKYEYKGGKVSSVKPQHPLVNNWHFEDSEQDEAILCHYIATVADKNGLSTNDLQHLFPCVLRMLRSDIPWAGNKK